MAFFKANFFWAEFQQGWTETFFLQAADTTTAMNQARSIAPFLASIKHVDVSLQGIRVTAESLFPPRLSRRFVPTNPPISGARGSSAAASLLSPEPAGVALMVGVLFNDGSSKTYMIRGVAQSDFFRNSNTGTMSWDSGVPQVIAGLSNALNNFGICGRRQDQTQVRLPVASFQQALTAGYTAVTLAAVVPYAAGTLVKFLSIPKTQLPFLRGSWVVTTPVPASFTIQYPYPYGAVPTITQNAKVQQIGYVYPAISSLVMLDLRIRKTGRPTALTRGRAVGIPFRRFLRAGV